MPDPSGAPRHVLDLVAERQSARELRDFARADALRDQVLAAGWLLRDTPAGPELVQAAAWQAVDPAGLAPRWEEPDRHLVSVVVHVIGWPGDVARAVTALDRHCGGVDYEVLLLDDGAGDATAVALEELARADARVRALHLDPAVGFGSAMDLGMSQATGRVLVWLDPHVEASGDLLTPLVEALAEPGVGLAGGWGVVSRSMLDFEADDGPEVDAVEGYLLAVPRSLAAGLRLDPKHRYYRNADLDYSFAVRDLGVRALRVPVPARRHRHRAYHDTDPVVRERASRRNYDRFLARWKTRTDLLTRGFTGYHRHARPDGTA
ncbi:MAG TPA: glycosyltransferase [Actinomycetes bacterium]|jgi:cysteinyl-tRNA synthetase|nr:glycosyltransferase [Actinomycetes bacterium]